MTLEKITLAKAMLLAELAPGMPGGHPLASDPSLLSIVCKALDAGIHNNAPIAWWDEKTKSIVPELAMDDLDWEL